MTKDVPLLYLVIIAYILKCDYASVKPGWCDRYSRNSSLLKEDVTVVENSERRFPNCQWQVHLQNVTRLFLELQISQMPFSNTYEYGLFQGQIAKTNYDAVRILSGGCNNGRFLLAISGTTQTTSKQVGTNTVCFQHRSNNEIYYETRLQLRVRFVATEVVCRRDQLPTSGSNWCKTVCLPNNKTRKECFEPITNYSSQLNSGITILHSPGENNITTVSVRKISKSDNILHQNKGLITVHHRTTTNRHSPISLSAKAFLTTSKRNLLQTSTKPPFTDQDTSSVYTSATLPTTQHHSEEQDCSQMTEQDIYIGLYIASTIAGVLTIIVIVLVVSCAKKNKEIKKLTTIMIHVSRSKAKPEHTRVQRQDFGGWSSTLSSLRPALPPRPDYLPSISNSTAETDISPYHHSDEELYDNIGIMKKHRYKVVNDGIHRNEPFANFSNQGVKANQNDILQVITSYKFVMESAKKDIVNENLGNLIQDMNDSGNQSVSSESTIGEYIDNTSVNSNTYRKVKKNRH